MDRFFYFLFFSNLNLRLRRSLLVQKKEACGWIGQSLLVLQDMLALLVLQAYPPACLLAAGREEGGVRVDRSVA